VLGDPDNTVTISNNEGTVPLGALEYPRAEVCTVHYCMQWMLLNSANCMGSHISAHAINQLKTIAEEVCGEPHEKRKEVSKEARRNRKYEAVYYPNGFAVLDWESIAQHSRQIDSNVCTSYFLGYHTFLTMEPTLSLAGARTPLPLLRLFARPSIGTCDETYSELSC
jgi:hypothetical protein